MDLYIIIFILQITVISLLLIIRHYQKQINKLLNDYKIINNKEINSQLNNINDLNNIAETYKVLSNLLDSIEQKYSIENKTIKEGNNNKYDEKII